jgi:hypothetical protein
MCKKIRYAERHRLHFRPPHIGPDWKAHQFCGQTFSHWKLASSPAPFGERGLQMNGYGIANDGVNTATLQIAYEPVTILSSNLQKVIDMLLSVVRALEHDRQFAQRFTIPGCNLRPRPVPGVEICNFPGEYLGLNSIEFTIQTHGYMNTLFDLAERPKILDSQCKFGVVRHDRSGISGGCQILAWMKTEAARNTESPYVLAVYRRSVSLRRVFHNRRVVSAS